MLTYSKTHNFENLKNNIFLFGALSLWQLIPFPLCYSIFTIYKMPPKLDAFSISILPPMLDTFELFTIDDDHITYTKHYWSDQNTIECLSPLSMLLAYLLYMWHIEKSLNWNRDYNLPGARLICLYTDLYTSI